MSETKAAKPRIAVTMGDPAGVGPEIIVKAWSDQTLHAICQPLAVGNAAVFRAAARLANSALTVQPIDSPEEATASPTLLPCLQAVDDEILAAPRGKVDARNGNAAYQSLVYAARLALEGQVDAITTAPLHKHALHLAGHHYPGHTELLAELCKVADFAMMLYLGHDAQIRSPSGLAIVHVTLHMALRQALAALDAPGILGKTRLVDSFLKRLGCAQPRLGVCALNPHGGENGLFGDEETKFIEPAVEQARAQGLEARGPYPADTLIARARDGEFDGVVAMYHDQGHIAIKLLAMHRAVNVTLGLPIVRTSVAHGTAFDVAWQGKAESQGMVRAIEIAARLAKKK